MNIRQWVAGFAPALLLCLSVCPHATAQTPTDTIGNTPVVIATVLDSTHFMNGTMGFGGYDTGPWDLYWGPDNKLWYSNKRTIERFDPATGIKKVLYTDSSGYVLGISTHSDFLNYPFVYAAIDTGNYYAASNLIELWRFEYSFTGDSLMNPQLLLNWWHPGEHSGGRVVFGADNKVYVSTAEYWAQNDTLFNNSGKILRVNPDGTVPADNPGADYTYTRGHRNPQGLVQVPNGNIFSSEHGQMFGNDELNLILPGVYYGWIIFDGFNCINNVDTCNLYFPSVTFPVNTGSNPPSGIDYYNHPAIPEFNGIIEAVTGINQGIIAYALNAAMDSVVTKNRYLYALNPNGTISSQSPYGRIRDVCAAPDGSVYFIARDRNHPRIMRIFNPNFTGVGNDTVITSPISAFPNPVSGTLNIMLSDKSRTHRIVVRDTFGRVVAETSAEDGKAVFETWDWPGGVYFIDSDSRNPVKVKVVKH